MTGNPARSRKMLTDLEAPYIQSIQDVMASQSAATIATWTTSYAVKHLLPLWETRVPGDARPRQALEAALGQLAGDGTPAEIKAAVNACRQAARDAEDPIAQGACRAIDASANAQNNPTSALGLVFYGALAIARDALGAEAAWDELETRAEEAAWAMDAALKAVAVPDEPHPATLQWSC